MPKLTFGGIPQNILTQNLSFLIPMIFMHKGKYIAGVQHPKMHKKIDDTMLIKSSGMGRNRWHSILNSKKSHKGFHQLRYTSFLSFNDHKIWIPDKYIQFKETLGDTIPTLFPYRYHKSFHQVRK
jgi:hypothetical protein